jgi:uncharacterized membrane protein
MRVPFGSIATGAGFPRLLLGYVEYLALLFLPGVAVIELFKLGGAFSSGERLGLAFGLSMAVDVLVLAFRRALVRRFSANAISLRSAPILGAWIQR